jgi:hypothetical protein
MKRVLVSTLGALAASTLALCLAGCPDEPKSEGIDAATATPTPTSTPTPSSIPTPSATPTPAPTPSAATDAGSAAATVDAGKADAAKAAPKK